MALDGLKDGASTEDALGQVVDATGDAADRGLRPRLASGWQLLFLHPHSLQQRSTPSGFLGVLDPRLVSPSVLVRCAAFPLRQLKSDIAVVFVWSETFTADDPRHLLPS